MKTPGSPSLARELKAQRAGYSDSALAAAYGITRQRVHQLCGPRPRRRAPRFVGAQGPTRAAFAAALLAWRNARGMSQAEAAAALRVHPLTISQWETGARGCSLAATVMLLLTKLH